VQRITTHCLGCHSDQNNLTTPFGDGKTPKQYAWDGTSVAARYSQTGTTTWGKYTSAARFPNVAKKNIKKAYSAHGNTAANKRYWDTTNGVDGDLRNVNTSGTINVECFDCHNSHGSTVAGITSRYSSATGRQKGAILKDTVAGKGGYSVAYKPYTGGSTASKSKRQPGASICLDCHMTQNAGSTMPWGYTSTYGASQAILGYWDSPFMGYTTAGPEKRYPFKKANPVKGGHFGVSSALSNSPMATIDGLCTPCHDPHGISPTLAANQQYGVPLLKGTWITSPYKEDTSPMNNVVKTNLAGTGEGVKYYIDQNTFSTRISAGAVTGITQPDSQFAGLCIGCHPKASLTTPACSKPGYYTQATCTAAGGTWSPNTWKSKGRVHEAVKGWKTSDATIQHNYTCSKCHSPHTNSALPRLMVTNCLDSRHKGRSTNNPSPVRSWSYVFDGDPAWYYGTGSGSGRIPGSNSGTGSGGHYIQGPMYALKYLVACHEGAGANNGNDANLDQNWNVKTPWTAP
jgi:hypothetical protein